MAKIQVHNVTRGESLVTAGRVADSMWTRLKGLISSPRLEQGEGLLIVPCQSIHTHFMGFPIDVLYVDAGKQVIGLHRSLPPWRFGRFHPRARFVIELPAGTLEATGTQLGDRLSVEGHGL
jgi:uncharacterized membrane protein (UPF0127 family)